MKRFQRVSAGGVVPLFSSGTPPPALTRYCKNATLVHYMKSFHFIVSKKKTSLRCRRKFSCNKQTKHVYKKKLSRVHGLSVLAVIYFKKKEVMKSDEFDGLIPAN